MSNASLRCLLLMEKVNIVYFMGEESHYHDEVE